MLAAASRKVLKASTSFTGTLSPSAPYQPRRTGSSADAGKVEPSSRVIRTYPPGTTRLYAKLPPPVSQSSNPSCFIISPTVSLTTSPFRLSHQYLGSARHGGPNIDDQHYLAAELATRPHAAPEAALD